MAIAAAWSPDRLTAAGWKLRSQADSGVLDGTTAYKHNAANQICWSGTGTPPAACPTTGWNHDTAGNLTAAPAGRALA